MFLRMIHDFKESIAAAWRLTSLAGLAALALLITIGFLCAAAFIYVLQNYGPVQACLTGAVIFFVLTLIAAGGYMLRRNQAKARAAEAARSAARSPIADPMLLATGLQLIRTIGIKKLIPILAIGGLALGLMASRSPPEDDAPEA